jgi:DNA-directed RNA polymerase subunit RPC12/RpoP
MKIRCLNCDELYDLQETDNRNDQILILRYAKCPHCDLPRYPGSFSKKHKEIRIEPPEHIDGQCDICGESVDNKKWNLCHNCYMRVWKKKTDYNTVYMKEWRSKNHYR